MLALEAALRLLAEFHGSWKPYLGCNILAEEIGVALPASGFGMASNGVAGATHGNAVSGSHSCEKTPSPAKGRCEELA
jgi:hypothetical protein